MTLRPYSVVPPAPPTPAALDYFRRYVAMLASCLPALACAHAAERQMLLHLLNEQVAYLQRCRRQMVPASPGDQQLIQQWCVLCFHLDALQRQLRAQTPPAAGVRCGPVCTCDLPYSPSLASTRPLDVYIPLAPSASPTPCRGAARTISPGTRVIYP